MARLTIAHLEDGFDGPGWYVLEHNRPLWGAYDTADDAAWAKQVHEVEEPSTPKKSAKPEKKMAPTTPPGRAGEKRKIS
jgi:hypothetical protein